MKQNMTAISGSALLTSVISTIPSPRELQRIETDGSLASKTVRPGPLETQSITFMLGADAHRGTLCDSAISLLQCFQLQLRRTYKYAEHCRSNLECVSFRAFTTLPGFSTTLGSTPASNTPAGWVPVRLEEERWTSSDPQTKIVPVEPRTGMLLRPPRYLISGRLIRGTFRRREIA
jgi:hypothetical protein